MLKIYRYLLSTVVAGAFALGGALAQAAPGDLLFTVNEPAPMVSCCGIGLDYDGTRILYTHYGDSTVYFTDLSGADLGSVALINPDGTPFSGGLNAIAYNFQDGMLYGGGWSNTNLYKTDLATGVTYLVKANAVPRVYGFIDGLAWDPTDNTFWMSDDVQCNVEHLDINGNDIGGFNGCTLSGLGKWNSGLAVSLNGVLWYGTNGYGDICALDTTVEPPVLLGTFTHVSGRDEDMVCGPQVANAAGVIVDTLLSQDAYGNWFAVFEAAAGDCTPPFLEVLIDIKPQSYPNCFRVDGNGVIPVAILGSADFDVADIDPNTLSFAGLNVRVKGNGVLQCSFEDVSGDFSDGIGAPDGFTDMVCQFVDNPDAWVPDDGTASLTGQLYDGRAFSGTDEICLR